MDRNTLIRIIRDGATIHQCHIIMEYIDGLNNKIEDLESDVNRLELDNEDLEKEIDKLNEQLEEPCEEGIKSLENYIWRVKLDGVYTDKLQDYIDNYLKFHNE